MTDNPKIWLSSPHMGGEELGYIHDAFEKNWIAPLGQNVNGFEKELRTYDGKKLPESSPAVRPPFIWHLFCWA